MHIAEKFERLLDTYRHPDGRAWTGAELADSPPILSASAAARFASTSPTTTSSTR